MCLLNSAHNSLKPFSLNRSAKAAETPMLYCCRGSLIWLFFGADLWDSFKWIVYPWWAVVLNSCRGIRAVAPHSQVWSSPFNKSLINLKERKFDFNVFMRMLDCCSFLCLLHLLEHIFPKASNIISLLWSNCRDAVVH